MYLAKFGMISLSGKVAKITASHDFSTYAQTYAFLQAAHQLGRDASARSAGDASSNEETSPPK